MEALAMANYIPSPRAWVREQVELYESSGGTKGTTLRDTGLPVVIVTHIGNKTGAIRKTPLMRVKDRDNYVLIGSVGGAPNDPVWVHNLRVNPDVEIRDETVVSLMRVREVKDESERSRLWKLAVASFPPYAEYQERTSRGFRCLLQSRHNLQRLNFVLSTLKQSCAVPRICGLRPRHQGSTNGRRQTVLPSRFP